MLRIAFVLKRKASVNIVFKQPFKSDAIARIENVPSIFFFLFPSIFISKHFIQEECSGFKLPKRTLLTLHPSQMVSKGQSTYDISGATRLRFSPWDENHPIHVFLHKIKGRPLFPANSRGVLYYHTDPTLPPIAGEVRFRLCDTVDNFERGSDLHILGTPWSLTLMRIAYTPNLIGLRKLLLKEGLVDMQVMADISKFPNLDKLDDRLTLFRLSQPFPVDLTIHELTLKFVTRNVIHRVNFPNLFTDRRLGHSMPLYSGMGHSNLLDEHNRFTGQIGIMNARFELSDLPDHRTTGPTLVLRFLDYLTRVEPLLPGYEGGLLYPKPGYLLQRRPRLHLQPKVWSYPLNARRYGAVLGDFITTTGQSLLCLHVRFIQHSGAGSC